METWKDLIVKLLPVGWVIGSVLFTFTLTSIFDYIKWNRHYKIYGNQILKNALEDSKKQNIYLKEELSKKKKEIEDMDAKLKAVSEALKFYLHEQETHLNGIKGALKL